MRNRPTNLLFLYTDEQAYRTLAAYGNDRISMPNVDRLAASSYVFRQAYVTQPVCTPSRSSLLTGQWPHTNGCTANNIPLGRETLCFPEMLTPELYKTAHIGKWHLGDEIFRQHGFDEWVSIEDMYTDYYSKGRSKKERSDYHHYLVRNGFEPNDDEIFPRGFTARLEEEYTKAAFVGDRSAEFIMNNAGDPFVLFVNFLEPHMPYFGPRDDQYDPAEVDVPDTLHSPPTERQPLKTRAYAEGYRLKGHSGLPLEKDDHWRRLIANYWGLCSLVDVQVGKILDALERSGVAEETIVVFTSDHGDMMGAHRLTAKCTQFEEAVRVPMLLRLPGQKKRIDVTGPMSHVDLVPTLLEIMEAPIHGQCQGRSLLPELRGSEIPRLTETVFIEWNGPNSGVIGEAAGRISVPQTMADTVSPEKLNRHVADPVRTVVTPDGWKYNKSYLPAEENESELYNLNDDPGETENLFGLAEHAELIERLDGEIERWRERVGDV